MKVTWWEILAAGAAGALLTAAVAPRQAGAQGLLDDEASLPEWRRAMLRCIRGHLEAGTLYQWGGGHGWRNPEYGVDCSGLAISCYREAGGDLYMTANDMYQNLPHVQVPQPGDLALYGRESFSSHVRVVERWVPEEGRAVTIGAEGGGSKVNDPDKARELDARVKRVEDHRGDWFLGFRTFEGYRKPEGFDAASWRGAS